MNPMRQVLVSGLLLGACLIWGCGGGNSSGKTASIRINAGGSTFINPLMTKWAKVYQDKTGVRIDYSSTGSGNGIQQMINRTIDFGCTDAPLNEEQLSKAAGIGGEVVHVPLTLGGVVPAYNLPSIDKPIRFTGEILAQIYLGKIQKWNDPALQTLNPDVALPDMNIAPVYRSDGSGTTYLFTDFLCKVSPEFQQTVGKGTSVRWPSVGIGHKGNEGVAGHITRTPGALGYVELIYALNQNLRFGAVQNRQGQFVTASMESISEAARNSLTTIPEDLRFSITDAPGAESYPISGAVWAVLYRDQSRTAKGQAIVDFLRWAIRDGQQYCKDLHYATLPEELGSRADRKLDEIKVAK
ncbi:MAG: phosphate ABC transporter substrate-binding protein PstS [Gemmatales bacterium]|nr:phosphate ABC transporter substrate-binding protein PstS [Gemmatales bacterium]MDW8388184.1 phosphate ABC transporter substrate-binding protein PstS [Gemmatales bacterium]